MDGMFWRGSVIERNLLYYYCIIIIIIIIIDEVWII